MTTVETQKQGSRKEEANSELHAKYLNLAVFEALHKFYLCSAGWVATQLAL